MKLAEALAPLVDLVYPPRCPSCGEGLAAQGGLCTACWDELAFPGEPACARCQRPFEHRVTEDGTCELCRTHPPLYDGITTATLYNDASRKLVLAFKHGGRIALAPMLARMIVARLPELPGEWLVIPVPLHRTRLWRRGFNQSALLARQIARARGKTLLVDGLVRVKQTPMLGKLGKVERARALAAAITANPRHLAALKGAQVMLVDDVLTSGATTTACLEVLRRAGAEKVRIACFARVPDEALT